jgi:uncharacterized protein (TIGR02246 family)
MRARILLVSFVLAAGLICAFAWAQNRGVPPAANPDQDIRKATADYAAAYNKGDVDSILAMWEPDAEYIDEMGQSTRGRAALAALFKKGLDEDKGSKMQIKTTSLRFLNEDIAMQDGTALLTHANGEASNSTFSSIWKKKDGKWLIHLARDLSTEPVATPDGPHTGLKELGWLVGDWTHEDKDTKTTVTGTWIRGQKFLQLEYSVRVKGEEVLSVTQIIGWDPTADQVHSWIFDSRGGFGEGAWVRQDKTWIEEVSGITADGRSGAHTSKWTHDNDTTFTYESIDREIDGNRLPDKKLTYQRTPASK